MQFINLGGGKIEKLCDPNDPRSSMQNVFLDVERGHIAATEGHAIAVSTIAVEPGDVSGYITPAAMVAYRAALSRVPKYVKNPELAVRFQALETQIVITDHEGMTQTFKRPPASRDKSQRPVFPNYERVMPEDRGAMPTISFDINLLRRVVEAIGPATLENGQTSSMVSLFLATDDTGNQAFVVKTSENGPIGLLMPMKSLEGKWITTVHEMDARAKQLKENAEARARTKAAESEEKVVSITGEEVAA